MAAAPGFSVLVELIAGENGNVTIGKLQTWPQDRQGRGEASRALATLCSLADANGVTLCGDVQPYARHPEEAIRLRVWLSRYGFQPSEENIGGSELYRSPRYEPSMPAANA